MNIDVTASQESFFGKNGQIAFEEVFTEADLAYLASLKKGYNLWKTDDRMKKVVLNKEVGKLIFSLTRKRPARLLFDSIVTGRIDLKNLCYQGVLIGALVPLTSNLITFFSIERVMEVEEPHLLIVYGESNVRYIFCEADPNVHLLKKCGYVYGDRLTVEDSPYLYR